MTNPKRRACTTEKKIDHEFIGCEVEKSFDGCLYRGIVVAHDEPYFLVEYDDGDSEELSTTELKKLLGQQDRKRQKTEKDIPPPCRIPGVTGVNFGGVSTILVEIEGCNNIRKTFLTELFDPSRILELKQQVMSTSRKLKSPAPEFTQFGYKYQLLTTTWTTGEGFRGGFGKKTFMHYFYVAVSGPGLNEISLQAALEKIADFGSIVSTSKLASRLELLRSPSIARRDPFNTVVSNIVEIEDIISPRGDCMTDGCGFISDDMITEILGGEASRHLAIQVRIFAPHLGVYKGVLVRKPGIKGIHVTRSMRKVSKSLTASPSDTWAMIVVVMEFPSTSNTQLFKFMEGKKSKYEPKKLSTMVTDLWSALGVDRRTIAKHKDKTIPEHTWVVGLTDPTGQIPAGHVFLTGFLEQLNSRKQLNEVFVTRSPCVLLEDGRLIPFVRSRPSGMSAQNWEFLASLPFGGLIFSSQGNIPLPLECAKGDLDGDLYLVCWNPQLVNEITPRPARHRPDTGAKPKYRDCYNEDWFREVQEYHVNGMANMKRAQVGKMYNRMQELYSKGGMDNDDARLMAGAYLTALDNPKHGGEIQLPSHLKEMLK